MKDRFNNVLGNVSKSAKKIMEKSKNIAVSITDQNEDGRLDLEDVSVVAEM